MFGTVTVTVVADNEPDKIIVLFLPASSVYVVEDEFVVNAKVVFPVSVITGQTWINLPWWQNFKIVINRI